MIRFVVFSVVLVLMGCSQEREELRRKIEQWEQLAHTEAGALDSLLDSYQLFLAQYPDDAQSPVYTYRAAQGHQQRGKFYAAMDVLEKGIEIYPQAPERGDMLILAGQIAELDLQDTLRAQKHFQQYRHDFPKGEQIATAELFFKSDEDKLRARIEQLDARLDDAQQRNGIHSQAAEQYLAACAEYVRHHHDEYSGIYCDRAAKLASATGESLAAVEFWTKIYEDHPDYPYYPDALYWLANEYENNMPLYGSRARTQWKPSTLYSAMRTAEFMQTEPLQKAKQLYQELLSQFPKHPMAPQAKLSLEHLGKDPNAIISSFQQKKVQ